MDTPQGPQIGVQEEITVVAASYGGKQVAEADTRTRPQLAFQWMDQDGKNVVSNQVTAIVTRQDPQTSQTLYAERTVVRVVALDADGHIVDDAYHTVRVDEIANTDFAQHSDFSSTTLNWQFSYQGDRCVASNIREDRPNPGYLTAIVLHGGHTDPIELLSLAGPRHTINDSHFLSTWDAKLRTCESLPAVPCQQAPEDILKIGMTAATQWVDQQRYSRSGAQAGPNGMRDWLEAAAWDILSTAASSSDPVVAAVGTDVQAVAEDVQGTNDREYGQVDPPQNYLIKLFASNFNFDAFRWDTWLGMYYHGFLDSSQRTLTHLVLHEARHCWQYQTPWADQDGDRVPDNPGAIDPHALRLKDDVYAGLRQWLSGNSEVHFNGPSVPDPICTNPATASCLLVAEQERDADYFTAWAAGGGTNILSNGLASVTVETSPSPLQIRAGQTVSGALTVTVNQWTGFADPVYNDAYLPPRGTPSWLTTAPNVAVELESDNAAGLSAVNPVPLEGACAGGANDTTICVEMTGATGSVTVGVSCAASATPGNYVMKVRVRQLVPSGDSMGDVLQEVSVPVEVLR